MAFSEFTPVPSPELLPPTDHHFRNPAEATAYQQGFDGGFRAAALVLQSHAPELFATAEKATQIITAQHIAYLYASKMNELRVTIAQEHHMATHDGLTGLLNLAGFNEQIEELGDKMVGMGLALIDLTNFKKVNDEHNHAVGNAVLVDIADVIRASTRKNDHTARIGGDEFLIAIDTRPHGNDRRLGETTPEEQITEVCHRLALFMTDVFTKHEGIGDLGFQMAVGATIWRRGDTLRSAMLRAEEAMKAHKEQQHDELGQYRG